MLAELGVEPEVDLGREMGHVVYCSYVGRFLGLQHSGSSEVSYFQWLVPSPKVWVLGFFPAGRIH